MSSRFSIQISSNCSKMRTAASRRLVSPSSDGFHHLEITRPCNTTESAHRSLLTAHISLWVSLSCICKFVDSSRHLVDHQFRSLLFLPISATPCIAVGVLLLHNNHLDHPMGKSQVVRAFHWFLCFSKAPSETTIVPVVRPCFTDLTASYLDTEVHHYSATFGEGEPRINFKYCKSLKRGGNIARNAGFDSGNSTSRTIADWFLYWPCWILCNFLQPGILYAAVSCSNLYTICRNEEKGWSEKKKVWDGTAVYSIPFLETNNYAEKANWSINSSRAIGMWKSTMLGHLSGKYLKGTRWHEGRWVSEGGHRS